MKHYPPTLSRTLDLIERRRLYTLHMTNLNPQHGGTNNSPFDPIPAVVHRDGKKKYYREFEMSLRRGEHARIKRPPSNKNKYGYKRSANLAATSNSIDNNTINRYVCKKTLENTQSSTINNDDNNNNNNNSQTSESADQVIERLVQESGMRVLDRSLTPRAPPTSPRKNRPNINSMSSTTTKNTNYVNNQTQTLKRNQTLSPHPPQESDNDASPRKSRAESHKSDDENKTEEEENKETEENKNEEEDKKEENDENKDKNEEEEKEEKDRNEEEENDENKKENEEEENNENKDEDKEKDEKNEEEENNENKDEKVENEEKEEKGENEEKEEKGENE